MRAMTPRPARSLLVAVAAALALGGCADAERSAVAGSADAFESALGQDPSRACDLLAPETRRQLEEQEGGPCASILPSLGLPDGDRRLATEVAGHSAQVRYGGDTLFLALFDGGWRVTAAGCERRSGDPADPYDCDVDGG